MSNTPQVKGRPNNLSATDTSLHTREVRLAFPPFYAVVGIYRLATDPNLYKPVWEKVRNGTRRGLVVGLGWVRLFAANEMRRKGQTP